MIIDFFQKYALGLLPTIHNIRCSAETNKVFAGRKGAIAVLRSDWSKIWLELAQRVP